MIRDPSDGTVREKPMAMSEPGIAGLSPVIETTTSGLPTPSSRSDYLARLDRSREWLAKYRTNPERVARLMGETGE
jgi:hypothetical protein